MKPKILKICTKNVSICQIKSFLYMGGKFLMYMSNISWERSENSK